LSTRYFELRIAMDRFNEAPRFAAAGHEGDRFERFISFEGDLPVPIPGFKTAPRVIVTPLRMLVHDGPAFNSMTPSCSARDITTKGFRLTANNVDADAGGWMAFEWVAIEESPGERKAMPDLRTGVFSPLQFAPFHDSFLGTRTFHDHAFGATGLFDGLPASVHLTPTDWNTEGHSVPAVGIVDASQDQPSRRSFLAHNVDVTTGSCAFNWATFSLDSFSDPAANKGAPERRVDTGDVAEAWFEPGGQTGDWHTWEISFNAPFRQAPVVLLTATNAVDVPIRLNATVVAVAQAVTSTGFRLAARSCDSIAGLSGFNWVAVGHPV
jgi:hypothetical protein